MSGQLLLRKDHFKVMTPFGGAGIDCDAGRAEALLQEELDHQAAHRVANQDRLLVERSDDLAVVREHACELELGERRVRMARALGGGGQVVLGPGGRERVITARLKIVLPLFPAGGVMNIP